MLLSNGQSFHIVNVLLPSSLFILFQRTPYLSLTSHRETLCIFAWRWRLTERLSVSLLDADVSQFCLSVVQWRTRYIACTHSNAAAIIVNPSLIRTTIWECTKLLTVQVSPASCHFKQLLLVRVLTLTEARLSSYRSENWIAGSGTAGDVVVCRSVQAFSKLIFPRMHVSAFPCLSAACMSPLRHYEMLHCGVLLKLVGMLLLKSETDSSHEDPRAFLRTWGHDMSLESAWTMSVTVS
jgi:hypothetical protein